MTTKFNKDMYAKMRSKKDELLSNIGKKGVCVTGKGSPATPVVSLTPVISGAETVRTISLAISVEDIPTPSSKRQRISARRRRRLFIIRPLYGEIKVWLWTGHIE